MLKNHNLALSISDCGWSMFKNMLEYKVSWLGKNIIYIGRFEPSSKLCSNCFVINKELKLSDREWTCKACQEVHDRDINAAKNIKRLGLKMQEHFQNNAGSERP
jgi:putative transposase